MRPQAREGAEGTGKKKQRGRQAGRQRQTERKDDVKSRGFPL